MDRLISEQAVLEAFREYQGSISDFYKAIKAIPSAEPKTGHWISTLATALTTNGIALNGVACSECGKVTYITNRTPICCPWCDTDMRGDDNEISD